MFEALLRSALDSLLTKGFCTYGFLLITSHSIVLYTNVEIWLSYMNVTDLSLQEGNCSRTKEAKKTIYSLLQPFLLMF